MLKKGQKKIAREVLEKVRMDLYYFKEQ